MALEVVRKSATAAAELLKVKNGMQKGFVTIIGTV
jgi:hypothetical protein